MKNYKYIILGAGASGLTLAATLKKSGENSFLILEKEDVAGGLCRSAEVDGAPLDIAGGHFLETRNHKACNFLFEFMPESEWNKFSRITKIKFHDFEIDFPFEANLWQLPLDMKIEFIESIAKAGCVRETPKPELFNDWISWKLGKKIADEYMLPYNKKLWSIPLEELGTYWLHKLPDVSFKDVLKSCIENKPSGNIPAHASFLYPKKFGYGEVWKKIAKFLNDKIILNSPVTSFDYKNNIINEKYKADIIINTIPWQELSDVSSFPENIQILIEKLKFVSINIDYFPDATNSKAHWIYEPDEKISFHRILCRENFLENSKGYWTETNSKRATKEKGGWRHSNKYAYPINTKNKIEQINVIKNWAKANNILPHGRWGNWEQINSDVAIVQSLNLAKKLLEKI